MSSPRRFLLRPLARHDRITSPLGPYDAYQSTLTQPPRAALQRHADRPGLPLPAPRVSRICQPCFMPDRPWAPSLQRFLPVRRRQTLSDRAVLPAVSHLAVPRLRGFELSSYTRTLRPVMSLIERMRSPTSTLFTSTKGRSSPGRFPPSRKTYRPRPTLLRNSSHGLLSCMRAFDSPRGSSRAP
jgi:hypothetical protein